MPRWKYIKTWWLTPSSKHLTSASTITLRPARGEWPPRVKTLGVVTQSLGGDWVFCFVFLVTSRTLTSGHSEVFLCLLFSEKYILTPKCSCSRCSLRWWHRKYNFDFSNDSGRGVGRNTPPHPWTGKIGKYINWQPLPRLEYQMVHTYHPPLPPPYTPPPEQPTSTTVPQYNCTTTATTPTTTPVVVQLYHSEYTFTPQLHNYKHIQHNDWMTTMTTMLMTQNDNNPHTLNDWMTPPPTTTLPTMTTTPSSRMTQTVF